MQTKFHVKGVRGSNRSYRARSRLTYLFGALTRLRFRLASGQHTNSNIHLVCSLYIDCYISGSRGVTTTLLPKENDKLGQ